MPAAENPEQCESDATVCTANDFGFCHSPLLGVASMVYPCISTRQQAYRTAAWVLALAELLPNEEVASTFEQVQTAINNS